MSNALIALGANLGDRATTLGAAIAGLRQSPGISRVQVSEWLSTDPIGGPANQLPFLNGAAHLETALSAGALHLRLQKLESDLGRQRRIRWDSRAIDLDLLLFDEAIIETEQLTVPHPRMAFRRFVLEPAAHVAPDMRHPLVGLSVGELLKNINRRPHRVTIVGEQVARAAIFSEVHNRLESSGTGKAPVEWLELEPAQVAQVSSALPTLLVLLDPASTAKLEFACPTLRLKSDRHDNAVSELVAAVEAMQ